MRGMCDYAKLYSHSHDAVIRVYDEAGNVIETHEHTGEFEEMVSSVAKRDARDQAVFGLSACAGEMASGTSSADMYRFLAAARAKRNRQLS